MERLNLRKITIAALIAGATVLGGTALADPQHGGYGMGHGMMRGYGMGPGMMGDENVPGPGGYGPRGPGATGGRYGTPPGGPGGYGPGYGMGPGMMGGYGPGYGMGPGMMGGYGPGYGMGHGMMGGYGPGYGMGHGMMGHMMGGYGMGPGMMGGYGPGYGMGSGMMGGYGMLSQLNLSPDQWKKVEAIHQDVAKKQWELAGKMREESVKLHNLSTAEKRDRTAIVNQYKKLQDLRLQRFQARLDAHERIEGVLTKEQREQTRRFGSW